MTAQPTVTRRWVRAAIAFLLAVGGFVAAAPSAQAAGYEGYCTDSQGVTVVVDFQQLGGGIVIRCAPAPLPESGTGVDALKAAGVSYEGVRRWGDAFICRLYGKPAATTDLAITGNDHYREQCIDTPPGTAYWSYWSASNGGSWSYSQWGAKNRRAIPGGFEGWSFSLNGSSSSGPAPRVAPVRPAAPVTPPPASTPAPAAPTSASAASPQPGTSPVKAGSSTPARTSSAGAGRSSSNPTSSAVPGAALGATPGTDASLPPSLTATEPAPGSTSTTDASSASPSGQGGASTAGATGDGNGLVVSSQSLSADVQPSGPPVATVIGIGVLAFLLTAGAGTAWRRRHR